MYKLTDQSKYKPPGKILELSKFEFLNKSLFT